MRHVIIFLSLLNLYACEYSVSPQVDIHNDPKSFDQIFETFWQRVNTGYVFWDKETTNWNEVYNEYYPLFKELDINAPSDVQRSFEYFQEITNSMIDGHLFIGYNPSKYGTQYVLNPTFDRKREAFSFHGPFDYGKTTSNYLDEGYKSVSYHVESSRKETKLIAGTIDNSILYISCSSFYLFDIYLYNADVKSVLDFVFRLIINSGNNIKGIIIDIRSNEGGQLTDLNFLLGRLIDSPLHYGYSRSKIGNGRFEFGPWIPSFIYPQEGGKNLKVPIIGLVDSFTGSTAELFALAIRAYPMGTLIGEQTYGATGIVTLNEIYNTGPFSVSDFMEVQMASASFRTLDNTILEGVGIEPDFIVPFKENELTNGIDNQLEKAISEIEKNY